MKVVEFEVVGVFNSDRLGEETVCGGLFCFLMGGV